MDSVKSSYYSGRRVSPFLTDTFGNDDSCNNTDHVQKWLNLANRIYGGYTRKELCVCFSTALLHGNSAKSTFGIFGN